MIDSRAETTPHEERSRRGKKERRKHTVCCVAQQTDVQDSSVPWVFTEPIVNPQYCAKVTSLRKFRLGP